LTHKDSEDQPFLEPEKQEKHSGGLGGANATCSTVDANLKFSERGAFIL